MLFAVSGGQGSGKSTVLSKLQADYNVKVIERKTSRSILSEWNVTLSEVNNNRDLTVKFQDEILLRKQQDEAIALSSDEIWFTERSYMDLFVYAVVAIGKDNEYSDWLDNYYNECLKLQQVYSNVFYLTSGHFKPVFDGVRAVNQHYQHMVDLTLKDYTVNSPVEVTIIDVKDINERIKIISNSFI